jgi:NAD(P)-dependent dehydrogenase (short-subunit alcohol dehydrogenase family)
MTEHDLSGTTALVTGASRGFGRAIAVALAGAGAHVVAVARDRDRLAALSAELGDAVTAVRADVTDAVVAGQLLDRHRPNTLVLNAGAVPLMRPVQLQSWDSFSRNWNVDVRQVFGWTREAMLLPLAPGSTVIAMSSLASLGGSPMSGGYAGAKATIRYLTAYAADEAERDKLDIRFLSVLPNLTAATDLGTVGVTGYAARQGIDVATFLADAGPMLTTEQVGAAVLELAVDRDRAPGAYQVTVKGLDPMN